MQLWRRGAISSGVVEVPDHVIGNIEASRNSFIMRTCVLWL